MSSKQNTTLLSFPANSEVAAIQEEKTTSSLPAIIDVDCNLAHKDLISLLHPERYPGVPPPFQILHHPSTTAANIVAMLSPCSTIEESQSFLSLLSSATNKIQIKTTVGVHPYHAGIGPPTPQHRATLCHLLSEYPQLIAAVGECGLDYSPGFPSRNVQIPWMKFQIDLAIRFGLPLFVHERLAHEDLLSLLDDANGTPVIIHCFTRSKLELDTYIKRGYSISLSGSILRNEKEDALACLYQGTIPMDRLMMETDAPYMGFDSCRTLFCEQESIMAEYQQRYKNNKERKKLHKSIYPNVPSALTCVLSKIVTTLNEGRRARGQNEWSVEHVAEILKDNSIRFFGFQNC